MTRTKPKHQKIRLGTLCLEVFCCLIGLCAFFPLIWLVISSFKPANEIYTIPLRIFPSQWTLEHYTYVFGMADVKFLWSCVFTLLLSASAVLLGTWINTMAAYVYARMDFAGKKLCWCLNVLAMFMPGLTIFITSFMVCRAMGMLNTVWVLLLPGLFNAGTVFWYRQFFLNMPYSLEEAAMIDGCNRLRIYWQIFLPLSITPIVVQGAGNFIGWWNSYLWPAITVTDHHLLMVMPFIKRFTSSYSSKQGPILATSAIALLPPVIIFLIFQRYIVQGFVLSGLK